MLVEEGFGEEDAVSLEPCLQIRVKASQTEAKEPGRKEVIPMCKSKAQRRDSAVCVE